MALYPMDDDHGTFEFGAALREFCTLGLFAAWLFALVVLVHGLTS